MQSSSLCLPHFLAFSVTHPQPRSGCTWSSFWHVRRRSLVARCCVIVPVTHLTSSHDVGTQHLRSPQEAWVLGYMMFKKIFFNIYLFLRESEHTSGRGAEREGDTESRAGSWLWAVSTEPNAGLKPMSCKIMTWAEVGLNQLSHPRAPAIQYFERETTFI